ncbi:hypothetical protein B0H34DRAFT_734020 [Crassisporium funariophilum]|nr:hypothetical protein B0H34DRAFT_734020 [Crassisporium funariophilum]
MNGPPPSAASSSKASSNLQPPAQQYTPWYTTYPYTTPQPPPGTVYPHYAQHNQYPAHAYQPHTLPYPYYPPNISQTTPAAPVPSPVKAPTPSPPPPDPETYKHWDQIFHKFLKCTGLQQTLRGLEADILVLNEEWEQNKLPGALKDMVRDLQAMLDRKTETLPTENEDGMQTDMDTEPNTVNSIADDSSLDTRKLSYIHLSNPTHSEPRSQTSINKSVSLFLAKNRARNDASNRAEFLSSLASSKRTRSASTHVDMREGEEEEPAGSCARVDAKTIDRDAQMRYDIAKNESGPLTRTFKHGTDQGHGVLAQPAGSSVPHATSRSGGIVGANGGGVGDSDDTTPARHPGLEQRLKNVEDHFAVRYGTSASFLHVPVANLDNHQLSWPPPPRATPVIVPPHLRGTATSLNSSAIPSTSTTLQTASSSYTAAQATPSVGTPAATLNASTPGASTSLTATIGASGGAAGAKGKGKQKNRSSLHRAVMERLEVQKAMSDLGGGGIASGQ